MKETKYVTEECPEIMHKAKFYWKEHPAKDRAIIKCIDSGSKAKPTP